MKLLSNIVFHILNRVHLQSTFTITLSSDVCPASSFHIIVFASHWPCSVHKILKYPTSACMDSEQNSWRFCSPSVSLWKTTIYRRITYSMVYEYGVLWGSVLGRVLLFISSTCFPVGHDIHRHGVSSHYAPMYGMKVRVLSSLCTVVCVQVYSNKQL